MNAVVLLTCILLLRHASSKRIPTFAGPYICWVEYSEPCHYGGKSLTFNIRNAPYNPFKPYERQHVTGNVTFEFPLDDNVGAVYRMDVFKNNQWKENSYIFKFPRRFCSNLRENAPEAFMLLNDGKPAPKTGPCKIAAGFHVLNSRVDWRFPNVPILAYGRYRLHVNIGPRDSPDAMCILVVGNIIPRP